MEVGIGAASTDIPEGNDRVFMAIDDRAVGGLGIDTAGDAGGLYGETDLSRRAVLAGGGGSLLLGLVSATERANASTSGDRGRTPNDRHRIAATIPAGEWLLGHPVGNGRLGAMMGGGIARDVISLNHDTLWTGQPPADVGHDGQADLAAVRAAVFAGDPVAADRLSKPLQGPYSQSYAPMANLVLEMDHGDPVTQYRRELDLDRAVASLAYRTDDAGYRRELFASHPDQMLVLRISTDRQAALSCTIGLSTMLRGTTSAQGYSLTLVGKAPTRCEPNYRNVADAVVYSDEPGRGMAFVTRLTVDIVGGTMAASDGTLRVTGANELVIRIAAATGFRRFDRAPDIAVAALTASAERDLVAGRHHSFEALLARHNTDHRALYRRTSLELRRTGTDREALQAERLFHLGRYLMIAASRPGTMPANLQGIWNATVRPPWSCNYTTNINFQMNYWPAESCGLAECHLPMIDHIERLAAVGARTARTLYGMPGWCVHHNSDVWAMSNPVGAGEGDPNWANWPMAGPWLAQHLWEHYRFSGDTAFLAKRAFPLMRGCAEFCAAWLVQNPRTGNLTTAPSISPENLFMAEPGKAAAISAGCTMDLALIRELFTNCIAAAALLRDTSGLAERLAGLLARLEPYRIGRYGQMQEWSADAVEQDPGHRHISHLYPVYPGAGIDRRRSPELALAARTSLARREAHGGSSTGWSRAWATAVWARLGDPGEAARSLSAFLAHSVADNLLDTHPAQPRPVFQIDGNLGITAAIAEMLLQSQGDTIAILPALPPNWRAGRVAGLRARGGHSVDIDWTEDQIRIAITAGVAPLAIQPPPDFALRALRRQAKAPPLDRNEGLIRIATKPGQTRVIVLRRISSMPSTPAPTPALTASAAVQL